MLIAGMASFAQEKATREKMTAEQRSELQVKKLTLDLGLNEQQKKEMKSIFMEQNAKRDALRKERQTRADKKDKLTADERFKMKNELLDQQIAMKERVKKVLTSEQFEKWEKSRNHKRQAVKSHMKAKKTDRKSIEPKK